MDFIHSKNIFLLTRDTLKLLDSRPMKHGSRVAYILYKMLQVKGGYEDFEMAEFAMLATLHDIGAYKTSDLNKPLGYETKDTLPHSIYGYMFLKHLSPFEERAKILLNHHVAFMDLAERGEKEHLDVTTFLALAECVDIYHEALGDSFNVLSFRPFEGRKFSKQSLDILDKVMKECDLFENLESEKHEKELSELMDAIMFTNEEKKRYMEMIMFCLDFRSHMKVQDTATCISLCSQLAQHMYLDQRVQELLYYGALIHDIGMLSLPKDIIESGRKLTDDEVELMRKHVTLTRDILSSRLDPVAVDIACRHHERCNGSGYPDGLTGNGMSMPEKILQVADAVTGMMNDRPYRVGMSNEVIRNILKDATEKREFDHELMKVFFAHFDEIITTARQQGTDSLTPNALVAARYEKLQKAMSLMKKK